MPVSTISIASDFYDISTKSSIEILFGFTVNKTDTFYFPIRETQSEITLQEISSLGEANKGVPKLLTLDILIPETQLDSSTPVYAYTYDVLFDAQYPDYKYYKKNGKTYFEFSEAYILKNTIREVKPFITIRSIDNVHYSPLIFNYSIELF